MTASQWVVFGVMLSGLLLIVWALKRQASIMKAGGSMRSEPSPVESSAHGEMQEITKALIAELDRKSASLETLLSRADEKIKALNDAAQSRGQEDPVKARVYRLADQGLSPVEIATTTGLPTGQIELMIGLRRMGG